MPINSYYAGHGNEVMSSMVKQYGAAKAKQVFYALANKKDMKPGGKRKSKARRKRKRTKR